MAIQKTQTLSLGNTWNKFIENKVKEGRYGSASEVVRTSLRLLEEKENDIKMNLLRGALIDGEHSGYNKEATLENLQGIRERAKELKNK